MDSFYQVLFQSSEFEAQVKLAVISWPIETPKHFYDLAYS